MPPRVLLLLATLLLPTRAMRVMAVARRSSPVKMGLFDSIKNAISDIESASGRKSASAAHILVKKQADALLLKEQIEAGEITFSDAARQYSTCPSSSSGGSLGRFGPGQMARPFDALVFDPDTQLGEVYSCSTAFGTHLVKVLERTGVETTPAAEVAAKAAVAAEAAAAAEAASADPVRAAAEAAAAAAAAEAAAAAAEASSGEMMEVACPEGLAEDRQLRIALPDGRQFDVVVPDGVAAGDSFLVGPFPSAPSSGGA